MQYLVSIIVFASLILPALADDRYVVTPDGAPACPSSEILTKLALETDVPLERRNTVAAEAGCIRLQGGEIVHLITSSWAGLAKVRPDGQLNEYWTFNEAISAK